jgi:hypothetical protein
MFDEPSAPPDRPRARRIWVLLSLLALTAGGVAAWWYWPRHPDEPDVYAKLYIAPRKVILADVGQDRLTDFNFDDPATQAALVRSRPVLTAGLKPSRVNGLAVVKAQRDPVAWLEEHLVVDFPEKEILRVGLKSGRGDLDQLATIVDAVCKAYMEEVIDKERIQAEQRLAKLRHIALRYDERLRGIRSQMRKLQEQVGPGDKTFLAMRQELARGGYDQARAELLGLQGELRTAKSQLDALERARPAAITGDDITAAVEKEPAVLRLVKIRGQLEERLDESTYKTELGEKDPAALVATKQLARLKAELEKRRKDLRPQAEKRLRESASADQAGKIARLKEQIQFKGELLKLVQKDTELLNKEAQSFTVVTLDLSDFQRDLDEQEDIYKALRKRANAIEVELEAPQRVRVLQEAVINPKKHPAQAAEQAARLAR